LIRVIKINDSAQLQDAFRIRVEVFVDEQGVSREDELDDFEDVSHHFLAISNTHGPCGAARWRFTDSGVKLERFAVISPARNQGVAKALVKAVLRDIEAHPKSEHKPLYLHAQLEAVPLYEKFGFKTQGLTFEECGITHFKMIWVG